MTACFVSTPNFNPLIQHIIYTHHCHFQLMLSVLSPQPAAGRPMPSLRFLHLAAALHCCLLVLQTTAAFGWYLCPEPGCVPPLPTFPHFATAFHTCNLFCLKKSI